MSVGIMDADFATYTLIPFNLEAMKLSAYYKRRHEMVILTNKFLPERHQRFIYLKDFEDGNYPDNLLTTPNVEYYGLAFSNNKYQPLPLEIERMKPDTTLYERMGELILGSNQFDFAKRKKIFQNLMTAEHCRISLDGQNIWDDYGRQFKDLPSCRNIIFHDYDLNQIKGGLNEVKKIMARARTDGWATRIGMKFPVNVQNGQDLLDWSNFKTNSTFYNLQYNGVMDDEPFSEWVGICKEKAVYTQMNYMVTPSWYEENYFLEELLPKIFRQVILSRSYRVFFSLKYEAEFFTDKRWCDVLRLFNFYHNSYASQPTARYLRKINNDTLFDFASSCANQPTHKYVGEIMSLNEIRNVFYFVREHNYELFKEFYELTAEKIGGKL